MKITVLGAGAWGTALGLQLSRSGHPVTLWGHDSAHVETLRTSKENQRYLPGIPIPTSWTFQSELESAVAGAEAVIMAVPSRAFRQVAAALSEFRGPVVSVTKGIEYDSGLTMTGIIRQLAPAAEAAALSGPSLAMEVAKGVPTAVVAAAASDRVAQTVQRLFHGPTFRVYTSNDLLGVELGGALKNVVAIAAGVCDGLGFGDNSKAALITRGIVEISRLGQACGAEADTFSGLSGLGDLAVTCFSRLSRNRAFGERIGRGESVKEILSSTVTVAEGYPTSASALRLAERYQVPTPIIREVSDILYRGKNPMEAVRSLMERDIKPESLTPPPGT